VSLFLRFVCCAAVKSENFVPVDFSVVVESV